VQPVNPLLAPAQMAALLQETGAKVLVTLKAFPKTDLPQKVNEALALAPGVTTVLEVDLRRYLRPPLAWIVPLIRPKNPPGHRAQVLDFHAELRKSAPALDFAENMEDRFCAYFHTGGTTGMPKIARHRHSGIIYNGFCGADLIFDETSVLICPLPMFHVFAAYPVLMNCIASGAHMVMPTPQGYRGEGVYDNFWKLVERWRVTFIITVPTALSNLMQRPVDADVSSLKYAFSGSSALPVELFQRFSKASGVKILEGYGLTEATCLVAVNPPTGANKIGSVGIPFPYTDVRILSCDADGTVQRECGPDEVGEICVANPGVSPGMTYTEESKNRGLFAGGTHLRTGDLGRIDADGYIWITGRAKDLIIRGGHNIDPALIEDALAAHPAVALSGAIGQPDAHAGELPCVYVELVRGATATPEELRAFAEAHVPERAAVPRYVEIMDQLPKTAVGKILKNELRKSAITRVYGAALREAGLAASVAEVYEDRRRGLIARLRRDGAVSDPEVASVLGAFATPWEWAG
jgi:acyl-CoA synthetase (AMP-forming)/AMP-acid ligase II